MLFFNLKRGKNKKNLNIFFNLVNSDSYHINFFNIFLLLCFFRQNGYTFLSLKVQHGKNIPQEYFGFSVHAHSVRRPCQRNFFCADRYAFCLFRLPDLSCRRKCRKSPACAYSGGVFVFFPAVHCRFRPAGTVRHKKNALPCYWNATAFSLWCRFFSGRFSAISPCTIPMTFWAFCSATIGSLTKASAPFSCPWSFCGFCLFSACFLFGFPCAQACPY